MHVFVADLSSQSEGRRLAEDVLRSLPRLDVLVNNVGGYRNTRHLTADGLERTFAANHLAPFLLTDLLLDRLKQDAPSRIVNVASNAHARGRIDFSDLQRQHSYSGARAYNQSKLAKPPLHLRARQPAARNHRHVNALHPGMASTSFGADDPGAVQHLIVPVLRAFMKTATEGAATSIHVASAPNLERVTRLYFAKGTPKSSSKASYDQAAGADLWQVSALLADLSASQAPATQTDP